MHSRSIERKCSAPDTVPEKSLSGTTRILRCEASWQGSRRSSRPSPSSVLTSFARAAASDLNPQRSAIIYPMFRSRS